jgi:hypothetical protein
LKSLSDLNDKVKSLWQETLERLLSGFKVLDLLSFEPIMKDLEGQFLLLSAQQVFGEQGPEEAIWSSYKEVLTAVGSVRGERNTE